jgi:DNA polymerase III delta prime subunit
MSSLQIHQQIKEKLKYFHDNHKIPNIIFNGPSGSGKSTIVNEFISLIYNNNIENIKKMVMYVNCAHGKGIKFIREELKFFAKTNINSNGGDIFKSIILLNGDKLTIDAQSALRRCIELFNHSTRFFIIVEDKYKLLKPILSRFCEIYISEPEYNGQIVNLYKYNIEQKYKLSDVYNLRNDILKKELQKSVKKNMSELELILFVTKLYEKAYSALDVITLLEDGAFTMSYNKRYELLIAFNKVKKEFRNEKILLLFIINFIFLDNSFVLENISFM